MLKESIGIEGYINMTLTSSDGNVVKYHIKNLIVNGGVALLTSRMRSNDTPVVSHISLGTATHAASATDTAISNQLVRVPYSTLTTISTSTPEDTLQYTFRFPPGSGTGAISEVGLYNAANGGTMFNRASFPVINKGPTDTLVISWNIRIAQV